MAKLFEVEPREQVGPATGSLYEYQYHQAAAGSLNLIEKKDTAACIYCEWHDDYVLETESDGKYAFFQVKTRSSGPWSVGEFFGLGKLNKKTGLEGTTADRPETCWLEVWSKQAQTEGRRALDQLRDGVERALENLGTGFILHKANQDLCKRLKAGELNKQDLYRQLLRLVYRLIFVFVAEDRDLLHSPVASDESRSRYARFYSGQRLRRMAERTRGGRHADLWVALRVVFSKLSSEGSAELGLPALGGFLFGPTAMPDLESAELSNERLLQAVRNLALVKDRSGWRLVDYRNLGSEELGSVYESLLELNPTMELDAGKFTLSVAAGNQRKTSGSYYTPDSLVQCLLDSALEPVAEKAISGKSPDDAERAILALKVCDPAVGSGHFLVGAAHRLAKHLSLVRAQAAGDSEPSPLHYQRALRDVIGHCLYGVDINPMAAELCRVGLWLEAIEPGKPLSFLDHHIRVGNSLLGVTPALLAKGIPDEAFTPIEGDDKAVCRRFKRINGEEQVGFRRLFAATTEPWERLGDLAASMNDLNATPDDSIEGVREKQRIYEVMVRSGNYLRFWADAWCASFVWKKTEEFSYPITEEVFRRLEKNPDAVDAWMRDEITRLSRQYQFFHWHLEFPDVFYVPTNASVQNENEGWSGGFDLVLGNPPWERVKLQEKEWFAERCPEIANAPNSAARKKMIAALRTDNPELYRAFHDDLRKAEGESAFMRNSGRFPLCGRGDVNTFTVFTELSNSLLNSEGQAGCIVPTGIATGDTSKAFFQFLVEGRSLVSLMSFENEEHLFQGIHNQLKFALITIAGRNIKVDASDFVFFARKVEDLEDKWRHFSLTSEQISLLNPNTKTCPVFRSASDALITATIYARFPVLVSELERTASGWVVDFGRAFDMAIDSHLFVSPRDLGSPVSVESRVAGGNRFFPLYEAKMIHHFDHRYGSYDGQTQAQANKGVLPHSTAEQHADPAFLVTSRYWVSEHDLARALPYRRKRQWMLAWRAIGRNVDARTFIATAIPAVGAGHTLLLLLVNQSPELSSALLGALSSFIGDYIVRQKMDGAGVTYFIVKQLAVPTPEVLSDQPSWMRDKSVCQWVLPRMLELIYTAWDMVPFAQDLGWPGPPFRWDEERRFVIRCELDAAFFNIYLPSEPNGDWSPARNETHQDTERLKAIFPTPREAVKHVMETFPIIRRKDEEKWGEYRTKRVILEIYDAMAEAARTGVPYQTRLDPPPADIRVAHAPRTQQSQTEEPHPCDQISL